MNEHIEELRKLIKSQQAVIKQYERLVARLRQEIKGKPAHMKDEGKDGA